MLSTRPASEVMDVFFAILEKASTVQPILESITIPCTQIVQCLLPTSAGQIWNFVRSSHVLIPLDKSTSAPVWGSRTASMRSIFAQNKQTGTYAQTIATLSFIEGLVEQARSGTLLDAPSVVRTKSEVLLRAVQWCCESVWSTFGSWKYAQVESKYEIARALANVFLASLEDVDCGARAQTESNKQARELVVRAFLLHGSAAYLSPLFQFVVVPAGRRAGDAAIVAQAEETTSAVLKLLARLLSLSRTVLPDQPSTLERICFSHPQHGAFSSILPADPIATLFQLVQGDVLPSTAAAAARVLSQLCVLARDWEAGPERPSFLSHFGGFKNTQRTMEGLLSIAGDPFVDAELQISVWNLLIAVMQSQPGLADVLIAGQNGLVQLAASTSTGADGETGMSLAVQVLIGWKEAWELQPAVLATALRFLCAAWEGYIDSSKPLKKVRADAQIWNAVKDVLTATLSDSPAPLDLEEIDASDDVVGLVTNDAHRRLAKACAARLAALDSDYAISNAQDGKPVTDASVKCLANIISSGDTFEQAIAEAAVVDFDPGLISTTRDVFADSFRKMHLEAYQITSTKAQHYGPDFFYRSSLLSKHASGLAIEVSGSAIDNALTRVTVLNLVMSRLDASTSLLSAWCDLLDVALSHVPESQAAGATVWKAIQLVAKEGSQEKRAGAIVQEMHNQRLKMLRVLLEYGTRRSVTPMPESIPAAVELMRAILSSDAMDLLQSVKGDSLPFHRAALQAAYLMFYKLAQVSGASTNIPRAQRAALLSDTEASLAVCFSAVQALLVLVPSAAMAETAANDLSLAASVILQILSAPVPPRVSVWLAYCQDSDLFRAITDFLLSAPTSPAHGRIIRTLYELCTALAVMPQAAEKLALAGLVSAINNNSLTQQLEDGTVRQTDPADIVQGDLSQQPQDQAIWCAMLACMTQLVVQLGSSVPFMENEVVAFCKLYSRQISQAYQWSATNVLTTATLSELQNSHALLHAIVNANSQSAAFQTLLPKSINGSLTILQQLVYLLQHPNLLSTMLEPLSGDERAWLQNETSETADLVLSDLHKRPVAATVLQAVFKLSHVIVMTLVRYTQAFTILARDTFDWPKDRTIIQPVRCLYPRLASSTDDSYAERKRFAK